MDKLFELLKQYLSEEILTEDVQNDIKANLDVMINEQVNTKVAEKEKELEEKALLEMEEFKVELVEKIDDYMNYATDEFFTKNEVAIVSETKVDLAESIISSVKEILTKYGIEIEPETVSQIDQLKEEVETVKKEINNTITEKIELQKQLDSKDRTIVFMEMTSELSDKEKTKVKDLLEGLEFKDIEDYKKKLAICIEKSVEKENLEEEKTSTGDDIDKKLSEEVDTTIKYNPTLNPRLKKQ